jgi:hypothetical protein
MIRGGESKWPGGISIWIIQSGHERNKKFLRKIFFDILMAHLSSGHKVAKIKTKQEFVLS